MQILRAVDPSDPLADLVLQERLRRGDHTAVAALLPKLKTDGGASWWRLAQFVWSDELDHALDEELQRRDASVARDWGAFYKTDDAVYEQIMRLPAARGEILLLKHWDHLKFSPRFVQTALYIATPRLRELVEQTVASCPKSADLFEHIGMYYGIRVQGRSGVTRPAQIEALVPYLDMLNESAIHSFWDACHRRGWLDLRRRYFDGRLSARFRKHLYDDDDLLTTFDDLIERNQLMWVDRVIEDCLGGGVAPDHLMQVIERWFFARKTFDAMQLAAMAIVQNGTREDLAILDIPVEPNEAAESLRADTRFAVKRRRLH